MTYVIFRIDYIDTQREVYVDAMQHLKSTLVEVTDKINDAKQFPSAREAYEWAQRFGLDWWRVGVR